MKGYEGVIMDIKIAPDDSQSMSQSGDAILKSLQNSDFAKADLIVRESIQNALDATKGDSKFTRVEYHTGKFNTETLNPKFKEISDELTKRYPKSAKYLSISDKGTVGLNGKYDSDKAEDLINSNFYKLVFGIGKNQEAEGAGGSWGLGKTSYFRMGIGLVIYYTRVKIGDEYEERLIGSLIENPKEKTKLLKKSSRGIAWWGTYKKNNDSSLNSENGKIYPITDEESISEILDVFGLKSYVEDETGTTIIIPYVKDLEEASDLPWEKSWERALSMSVQRWYSPRLVNRAYSEHFNQSQLVCTVNGNSVGTMDDTEPFFGKIQTLYNAALIGKTQSKEIAVEDIIIPKKGMENPSIIVGRVAYTIESKASYDYDPQEYVEGIREENKNGSDTIVAFARKPGMVVRYAIGDKWSARVKPEEGKVLLAFFVPNSDGKLYRDIQDEGYETLEQYLRAGEKADHADWFDIGKNTLVKRLRTNVAKSLEEATDGTSDGGSKILSTRLGRKYSRVLPPENYGKSGRVSKKRVGTKGTEKEHGASIRNVQSEFGSDGNISLHFEVSVVDKAKIELCIKTQGGNGKLSLTGWNKEFNTMKFPVEIKDIHISNPNIEVDSQDDTAVVIRSIESNQPETSDIYLTLELSSYEYQPQINIQNLKGK